MSFRLLFYIFLDSEERLFGLRAGLFVILLLLFLLFLSHFHAGMQL